MPNIIKKFLNQLKNSWNIRREKDKFTPFCKMSAEEDDFFGIKMLNSMPLPQFFYEKTRSHDRRKKKNDEVEDDVFEEHFFPELSRKGTKGRKEGEDDAETETFIEEQFFPRRDKQTTSSSFSAAEALKGFGTTANSSGMDASSAEQFELEMEERTGLKQLWALVDPIWKYDTDQLVDYMSKRVIYETDDFIALDKPFQMAYSSGPENQPQLDRILQKLKSKIAPGIDLLYIVSSLDKHCSGVILFAKSEQKQLELRAQMNADAFLFRYRCICRGIPKVDKARINIPLIKVLRGNNFKLCPLVGEASDNRQLYHLNTDIRLVNECRMVHCSLLDAFVRRSSPDLVRSHLYYGLNCPIVGDKKYVKARLSCNDHGLKTAIAPAAMDALALRRNDIRKMPMFLHRAEVHVPIGDPKQNIFHFVRAEVPPFFAHALKKLHLLKK